MKVSLAGKAVVDRIARDQLKRMFEKKREKNDNEQKMKDDFFSMAQCEVPRPIFVPGYGGETHVNNKEINIFLGRIIDEMRKGMVFHFAFIQATEKYGKEVAEEASKFIS